MMRSIRTRLAGMSLIMGGVALGYLVACTKSMPEQPATAAADGQTKQPATAAEPAPAGEAPAAEDGDAAAVRAALAAYVEAFNNHDAQALANSWAEDAVYRDRNTGEEVEGRAALVEDFAGIFQAQPNISLEGNVQSIDLLTPSVAQVEGKAIVTRDDGESMAHFTAIWVKSGDSWLLRSVQESAVAPPASSGDALAQLEWLLGHWVENSSDELQVDTVVRWAPGGAFLIRAYSVTMAGDVVREGTQVIGWDPRAQEIRSWAFNSDGSFGDGVWSKVGDAWYVKSTQTLADGSAASGTYVMTPQGDDAMTMQLIGHEIEGEPQPGTEAVTVTRAPEASGDAASESTSPTATEE